MSLDKTSLSDLGVISLVQLNASGNYISDIDEEAFLGQSKLHTVDLSINSLMYIEPKTFIRNPSLETLSLSSNRNLRMPEEDSFLYSNSLRVLKLSDCNLYRLPLKTFQSLPNLQELHISHNQFETLNSLPSVGRLTFLDVRYNYLADLESGIFEVLPELMRLNLGYNKLSTLNQTVMPQLVKVSSSVELSGNPWLCDCLMFDKIYSWCHNNRVDLELVCLNPPKFKGKQWSNCNKAVCDDRNTDFTDNVNEKYINSVTSSSFEDQIQYQETVFEVTYASASGALIVVFVILFIAMVFMLRSLQSRSSPRKASANNYSEV
jgi:hypothetical protein